MVSSEKNKIEDYVDLVKKVAKNKKVKLGIGLLIISLLPISNFLKVESIRTEQLTNSVGQQNIPIAPVDENVTPVAVDELTAAKSRADFESRKLNQVKAELFNNVNNQLKDLLTERALRYQALAAQKASELGISPELAIQTLTNQQIENLQNIVSDPNTQLEKYAWALTELQAIRYLQQGSLPERGLDKLPTVTEFNGTPQPTLILSDLRRLQEQISYYLASEQQVKDQILRQAGAAENGTQTNPQ